MDKKFYFSKPNISKYVENPLKTYPEFSLQRLSVYTETRKELDLKLKAIPGGNAKLIAKLYECFEEVILDELRLAYGFYSNLDSTEGDTE